MSAITTLDWNPKRADKLLPKLNEAAKEMPYQEYQRLSKFQWNNAHSRRFQRLTGDKDLVCAWAGDIKRWVFAQMRQRTIVKDVGWLGEQRTVERVPVCWWTVEDDSVSPPAMVDIRDPRIPGKVLAADRHGTGPRLRDRLAARKRRNAERKRQKQDEFRQIAKMLHPAWEAMMEHEGIHARHTSSGKYFYEGVTAKDRGRRGDGSLILSAN